MQYWWNWRFPLCWTRLIPGWRCCFWNISPLSCPVELIPPWHNAFLSVDPLFNSLNAPLSKCQPSATCFILFSSLLDLQLPLLKPLDQPLHTPQTSSPQDHMFLLVTHLSFNLSIGVYQPWKQIKLSQRGGNTDHIRKQKNENLWIFSL